MKTDIHPKYFDFVEIRCSCGNTVTAGSTKETLKTELCSACHPFYTGQQKLVDTAGRVDKFEAKRKKAAVLREDAARRAKELAEKKKPKAYVEKVVPQEIIERATKVSAKTKIPTKEGKWGKSLGESPAEEIVKEQEKAVKKPARKKTAAQKPTIQKPAAEKTAPLTAKKKPAAKKSAKKINKK